MTSYCSPKLQLLTFLHQISCFLAVEFLAVESCCNSVWMAYFQCRLFTKHLSTVENGVCIYTELYSNHQALGGGKELLNSSYLNVRTGRVYMQECRKGYSRKFHSFSFLFWGEKYYIKSINRKACISSYNSFSNAWWLP